MSHLSHEELWEFAQRADAAPAQVPEHLAECDACSDALADIQGAQHVLALLPPVPELPKAMALRVGEALAEKADASLLRSPLRSWFAQLFAPRLVLACAAVLLAVVAAALYARGQSQVPPPPELAVATPAPTPVAEPAPVPPLAPAPEVPATKTLTASVATASRASSQKKPVQKAQRLEQGTTVATEAKGSLWLNLPDGSRAGLTSSSQLTLAKLEAKALDLNLQQGSVALDVPHRAERLLTVTAGVVTVKDLGTRFLVSKNDAHVLVAVQEGEVEVVTPNSTQVVKAGHAVSWHDGRLDILNWDTGEKPREAAPAKASPSKLHDDDDEQAAAQPAPAVEPEAEAAENETAENDDDEEPVQVTPAPGESSADEWVLPQQVKSPKTPAHVPVVKAKRRGLFNLTVLEEKLEELTRAFAGVPLRESLVKSIARAVDHADCAHALVMADAWLRDPVTSLIDEPKWRRSVLTQKLRCFTAQGRTQEALDVKRELDGP